MSQGALEERIERLEIVVRGVVNQLADAAPNGATSNKKNWRRTIGMFDGDPVMAAIIDEALQSRAQDRQQFYEAFDRGEEAT